ncbi:MAG: tRNA isopentenyl-2-thiomethyl-A-37 hydroxylase MiaE [Halioglobus sp.]|nr:tRNA isopentenyl-2-thiomethyl-A-37 hydroxylase MiaE [Halioglobus sp.]
MTSIGHIYPDFLYCATPGTWLEEAAKPKRLQALLTDHANCERKAADSALAAMKRYGHGIPGIANSQGRELGGDAKAVSGALGLVRPRVDHHALLNKLSKLAREELRHFEQVITIMKARALAYPQLSASRYAGTLRNQARSDEPGRLVDGLLIGAIIEARSCERFAALAPRLDVELGDFYRSLLKSESRHFLDYLRLAQGVGSRAEIDERLPVLLACERGLIEQPDADFRFHSGVPLCAPKEASATREINV